MSSRVLEFLDPGLLTTVQDRGRHGYQKYGVPVSGAFDEFALRVSNLLVGNRESAAGLEMTVLGPRVRFLADTLIAVTGADLSPLVDGNAVPPWRPVRVSEGQVLSFQGPQDGVRSYLAVAGGIDVPLVMGSRSTYLKGGFGGLDGSAIKAGDVLGTILDGLDAKLVERSASDALVVPTYGHIHEIRVVLGPQDGAFTSDGIATLLGSEYALSIQSDRIGYRLDGPPVEHVSGPDIVSDGTALGSVQIPGDGCPIILLVDRGPTGGYAKIATVISVDISVLAQTMPGDTISFKAVTVEESRDILRQQEDVLATVRKATLGGGQLSIVVEGQVFEVVDEAGDAIAAADAIEALGSGHSRRIKATVDGRTYEFDVDVRRVE